MSILGTIAHNQLKWACRLTSAQGYREDPWYNKQRFQMNHKKYKVSKVQAINVQAHVKNRPKGGPP